MMFNNLVRFVAAASAFSVAYTQSLVNGNYQIKSVRINKLARNFAGTQSPSSITFENFAAIDADNFIWQVSKGPNDLGFTLANVGAGQNAAVTTEAVGSQVNGFRNISTQFAIESAGDGNFVIKSPNADLLWAVFQDRFGAFVPFLEPASGGDEEKFQLIAV